MSDKKINEVTLLLTGLTSLPEKLNLGNDYRFTVNAQVVSAQATDTQEGSIDMKYRAKVLNLEAQDDLGKTIKSVDKRKMSQKLRQALWVIHHENNIEEDFEQWKDKAYFALMAEAEEVLRRAKLL